MVHLGKLCLRRETLAFWPPLHLPVRTQVSDKNHLRRISKPIDGIKHSKPQIKFSQLFETQALLKKWRVVPIYVCYPAGLFTFVHLQNTRDTSVANQLNSGAILGVGDVRS